MIDRDRGAAGLMKSHRQIADIEQGLVDGIHAGPYRNVLRGSNASRTASPMKINSDSMMATAKKPVKPSHGACTLALPCDSNSPSDGEPGGNPKPRKSSAVSVITDEDTMNGRNVMVATMTFLPFIVSSSVMTLTALDFLGFGLPPGSPSLGELL